MIKKLISLICLVMAMTAVEAQTIHWITFIDTTDGRVGEIDVLGRQVLYSNFVNEVNAALSTKGYSHEIHDYYGDRNTPQNCKSIVEGLRVGPEDIIVFYYIGHGGRPVTNADYMRQHPYPQMCIQLKYPESMYIPLEWVDQKLKSKGARLAVTIGMCCNSLSGMTIKTAPAFSPNYGATYMSSNKINNIVDLFLNVKGSVLATSASPTQTSGCMPSEFGYIDCYTTVISQLFKNVLDDFGGTLTWDAFLGTVGKIVDEKTGGEQTPIFETHLTAASAPQKPAPKAPTQQEVQQTQQKQTPNTKQQQGDEGDWNNNMTRLLSKLIDASLPEKERINLEKRMNELFADGAQVRFLSQDGNKVIDREDADVFLGRLATSRLLLNIQIVEAEFDANKKIKSMKVREVYKK